MIAVLLALGCSGGDQTTADADPVDVADADTDTDTDSDTDTDTDTYTAATGDTSPPTDTEVPDFNGNVPAVALPPPVFLVTNMDGSPRSQPDLIGHPTVMWFYPAANTGG